MWKRRDCRCVFVNHNECWVKKQREDDGEEEGKDDVLSEGEAYWTILLSDHCGLDGSRRVVLSFDEERNTPYASDTAIRV